jgi:peptidoglycan/xylan/chitin deacetylase (PgdA/CDA1 family)
VSRGPSTGNAVALTYDAGADRGDAARLLAYLEDQNINVTFGMTGQWAESNPDLVRRLVADGDQLMNHTYDHRSFTGFSAKPAVLTLGERLDEIEKTDAILQALVGGSAKPFFRPPYGDEDPSVLEAAAAAGYRYSVLWTVDTLGWRGLPAPQIVDRSLRLAEPGAIYVLHVGALSQDIEATPAIVEGLRARGYRFVTLEQLIEGTTR